MSVVDALDGKMEEGENLDDGKSHFFLNWQARLSMFMSHARPSFKGRLPLLNFAALLRRNEAI